MGCLDLSEDGHWFRLANNLSDIYHHLKEGALLPISQDDKINVSLKGVVGEGEYVFHRLVDHHLLYCANGRDAWTR
jgi:hypothetical protein